MHLEVLTSRQKKVLNKLKFFQEYYLAGGTALALQIGHRISVDFDFFSEKQIPVQLFAKLKKIFSESEIKIIINNKNQLTTEIDKINFTFLYYPFPKILKLKKYKGLKLLSASEIAATKAYVLGRRATYKDYVDLYFVIKKNYSTLPKIIALAQKKYQKEFEPRLFLEQLLYLEDVEDVKIKFLKNKVGKKEIQEFFEQKISEYKI